jgi:hypothetical protein
MSKEAENKIIVARWFEKFWGNLADLSVVDELAAPNILVHYPMHGPIRGQYAVKKMITKFRAGPQFLGSWRSYCRGGLRRRQVGWRWHAYGSSFRCSTNGLATRAFRTENALHRNNRFSHRERHDCRRNRRGRGADCLAAARAVPVGKLADAQRCGLTSRPAGTYWIRKQGSGCREATEQVDFTPTLGFSTVFEDDTCARNNLVRRSLHQGRSTMECGCGAKSQLRRQILLFRRVHRGLLSAFLPCSSRETRQCAFP